MAATEPVRLVNVEGPLRKANSIFGDGESSRLAAFPNPRKMAATEPVRLVNVEGPLRKANSILGDEESSRLAAKFGIEDHLRSLISSLEDIQAFLLDLDAEASSVYSWVVKACLEECNDPTAMADDLLDEFAYEVRRLKVEHLEDKKKRNKVRNFFSSFNTRTRVKKISRRFKDINLYFRKTSHGLDSFGFSHIQKADASARLERITDSSVVESQVLGKTLDAFILKEILLKENENDKDLFFVSILGRGGIGKTTFAKVLYKDVEVVNHFDERMWVCVSMDDFNIDKILKDMFESLTRTVLDLSCSSREAILVKLLERLKGKKYLLVLDDVLNEDLKLWDLFTKCLLKLGGSRGSKIMVTTRLEQIAQSLTPGLGCYVEPKPFDYSWELFQRIAFAPGGPVMTPRLAALGRDLLKKCEGVPLAIKALGGLLYTMRNEADWLRIARNDIWDSNPINGALRLSYDHLPSISLKQCFLYCSIFPEDSVMEKDELIQLWMAQGLLSPPHGSDLSIEALGAQYLDIFLRTSFLQNAEEDEFDRGKSYKMHDLLHDLAKSLSKNYCLIMKGTNIAEMYFEAVHVSLINCPVEILESSKDKFGKLRTLRWVNCGVLGDILAYATSLRVLIVVDCLVEELPDSVGKLNLLHYLDISKTKIVKLPDSISKLYNLQTLKLYDLIELPKNFENLVNLRHLCIESFKDLDKLSALPPQFQELINPSSFKASFKAYLHKNCPIEKLDLLLEHPDRYASLRIYRLENVSDYEEATKAKLSSRSTIERLQLHWNARRENYNDEDVLEGLQPHSNLKHLIIENYKGSAFPSWMANTTRPLMLLVKVELEDCSCCEQVPPLGQLPFLKIVKILGMANVKNIGAEFYGLTDLNDQSSSSSSGSGVPTLFPALRELTIREMACLENWSEPGHLSNYFSSVCPLLEKFEVEQCPKLIRFPDIINSSHRRLRQLEIALCDSLAFLPEELGRLQSLEDLAIRGLPSLSQLSIGYCDNLKSLTIGGFSSASKVDHNTQHASGSKTSLHLKGGGGKLTSLPEELQYLSALRYLTISGYGGLQSLPDWFCKLQSLQILKLEFCGKLMYFPAAGKMQQLTNLDELDICYCPLLEERCTKGSRPELYKISYISRIKINSEEIKFRRRNRN